MTGLLLVVVGISVGSRGSAAVAILLFAVGGVTSALAARQLASTVRSPKAGFEATGELSSDQFNYIIWAAIGLPAVMIIGLLVIVLTGAR